MQPTVLIVDDDPLVSSVVCEVVRALHYHAIVVESGEAAMAILHGSEDVHIILSDVMMNGLDGIELAKRAMAIRPNIGVILTSGYPQEMFSIPRPCRYLEKPYALDDLAAALDSMAGAVIA